MRWEYTRLDQLGLTWLIARLNWLFSFDSDRIGDHQVGPAGAHLAHGNDMINDNLDGPTGWGSPVPRRTKRWAGQ